MRYGGHRRRVIEEFDDGRLNILVRADAGSIIDVRRRTTRDRLSARRGGAHRDSDPAGP